MRRQFRHIHPPQIEPLAPRQHRDWNLTNFRRRKDKLHMLRRFFQSFQKRIESALRQHVDFVDDEDFHPRQNRLVARALDDLANVLDAGVRRRVHLDHIGMPALDDFRAVPPQHRHLSRRPMDRICLVVERAGQNARRRGLADPAHTGQHVALRNSPRRERIAQGANHRLLTDQIVKRLRPVLPRQHDIRCYCKNSSRGVGFA